MCNADQYLDQYRSMCDQISYIDQSGIPTHPLIQVISQTVDPKCFSIKINAEQCQSIFEIWSHIDRYWSVLHIDASCPALWVWIWIIHFIFGSSMLISFDDGWVECRFISRTLYTVLSPIKQPPLFFRIPWKQWENRKCNFCLQLFNITLLSNINKWSD